MRRLVSACGRHQNEATEGYGCFTSNAGIWRRDGIGRGDSAGRRCRCGKTDYRCARSEVLARSEEAAAGKKKEKAMNMTRAGFLRSILLAPVAAKACLVKAAAARVATPAIKSDTLTFEKLSQLNAYMRESLSHPFHESQRMWVDESLRDAVIKSTNYEASCSGFSIDANGVEFNCAEIKGAINPEWENAEYELQFIHSDGTPCRGLSYTYDDRPMRFNWDGKKYVPVS